MGSSDLCGSAGVSVIVIGFTLIKVKPGHEKSVYRELQSMIGVKDVYHLFGEYSFFLIMQTEGQAKLYPPLLYPALIG